MAVGRQTLDDYLLRLIEHYSGYLCGITSERRLLEKAACIWLIPGSRDWTSARRSPITRPFARTLRANISETVLVLLINEQGEKEKGRDEREFS
jgi:hypothetical protein